MTTRSPQIRDSAANTSPMPSRRRSEREWGVSGRIGGTACQGSIEPGRSSGAHMSKAGPSYREAVRRTTQDATGPNFWKLEGTVAGKGGEPRNRVRSAARASTMAHSSPYVVAAVDAFMADPTTTAFLFGDGYRIDLAEAVSSYEWAKVTFANKEATEHLKRAAVRTAILLARLEKA